MQQQPTAAKARPGKVPVPWQERFWNFVTPADPAHCWEWRGGRTEKGYGQLARGRKGLGNLKAHRASYELHFGPIPEGLDVCHQCDNPPCVNPAHLFVGTRKENMEDMVRKGRKGHGGRPKLTDAQVVAIREAMAKGELSRVVAERFGITIAQVSRIATGKVWAKVGGPITDRGQGRRLAR